MTPPTSTATGPAPVGSSNSTTLIEPTASTYTPASTTHPAPLKDAHVDKAQSKALTDYLKTHHLPLVGAQVLAAADGERQVILFGYVATDYGKGDAESKARRYVNDPEVTVDNRIRIEPSLAKFRSSSNSQSETADAASMSGIQDYENQRYADQIQQQQQAYQNQSPPPMAVIIPLLGFFGGSFGGGSIGFGGGGFSSGFGGGYYPSVPPPTYRSYGYPAYP
jgi:hypothetical protein